MRAQQFYQTHTHTAMWNERGACHETSFYSHHCIAWFNCFSNRQSNYSLLPANVFWYTLCVCLRAFRYMVLRAPTIFGRSCGKRRTWAIKIHVNWLRNYAIHLLGVNENATQSEWETKENERENRKKERKKKRQRKRKGKRKRKKERKNERTIEREIWKERCRK